MSAPEVTRIEEIRREAGAAVSAAESPLALEELRIAYLGRKSELTSILRAIADLPPDRRGPVGKAGNEARRALEERLAARARELDASELERGLAEERIDVTLPGA